MQPPSRWLAFSCVCSFPLAFSMRESQSSATHKATAKLPPRATLEANKFGCLRLGCFFSPLLVVVTSCNVLYCNAMQRNAARVRHFFRGLAALAGVEARAGGAADDPGSAGAAAAARGAARAGNRSRCAGAAGAGSQHSSQGLTPQSPLPQHGGREPLRRRSRRTQQEPRPHGARRQQEPRPQAAGTPSASA